MSYVIVNLDTGRIVKRYEAKGWAQRHVNMLVDRSWKESRGNPYYTYENLKIMTDSEYMSRLDEIDPHVEVINMMSGKPVMIRMSERGTCVDPSTETYWSS